MGLDEGRDVLDCVITGQKEPVRAPVSSSKGPARAPASSSKPPKSSSKSPKSPPKIDRTREECTMRMELARKHLKSGELGKQTEESEVWAIWTDHVNAEVKVSRLELEAGKGMELVGAAELILRLRSSYGKGSVGNVGMIGVPDLSPTQWNPRLIWFFDPPPSTMTTSSVSTKSVTRSLPVSDVTMFMPNACG